jgi:hypothetical protein
MIKGLNKSCLLHLGSFLVDLRPDALNNGGKFLGGAPFDELLQYHQSVSGLLGREFFAGPFLPVDAGLLTSILLLQEINKDIVKLIAVFAESHL